MLEIRYFENQNSEYDEFVKNHPLSAVSQSWEWSELQCSVASRGKSWCFGVFESDKIVGSCMVFRHKLIGSYSYLYAHRGPIYDPDRPKVLEKIISECDHIAKDENVLFVRLDPLIEKGEEENLSETILKKNNFHFAHAQYQPLDTLQIDLTQSEEAILAQMKPKGRYNIKVAQKNNVIVKSSTDTSSPEFQAFFELTKITTERDGFYSHEISYYQRILDSLGQRNIARLYVAEHEGEILAAAISTFYGRVGIYYYGASSNEKRNLMAPYLLQWEMMREAKQRGCAVYDFLGIAPEGEDQHQFAKITQFKTRFGGRRASYIGAWEKVYRPQLYKSLLLLKKLRKIVRKLGIKI